MKKHVTQALFSNPVIPPPSSASRHIFILAFPPEPGLGRIKPLFLATKHRPRGRLSHVIDGAKRLLAVALIVTLHQPVELWVIYPGFPLAVHFELLL